MATLNVKDRMRRVIRRLGEAMVDITTPAALADESDVERKRQIEIIRARQYYKGDQNVKLTERQKEYLGELTGGEFRVNYLDIVVDAVCERMQVTGWTSNEPARENDSKPALSFAQEVWKRSRGDALQMKVHKAMVRDGEAFVFVYLDPKTNEMRFIFHPRYTSGALKNGTGYGCRAHYRDNDPDQPLLYVTKRWFDNLAIGSLGNEGKPRRVERMNVYYPDRIEKWYWQRGLATSGWEHYEVEGEEWPLPWVDDAGNPLGIEVIHFPNPDLTGEIDDVIPLQDGINKSTLDLLAAADLAGYPILFTKGGFPTTDGKPPADDGSNYLKMHPGAAFGTPKTDGDAKRIEAADLEKMVVVKDSLVLDLARSTDTPLSRFQPTRQIAAEGTLKQQEGPLLAKVDAREVTTGNAWEDCMSMALLLAVTFGGQRVLDPTASITPLWAPAATRSELEHLAALEKKKDLGVTQEQIFTEMGYDKATIARMMASDEMQERRAIRRMNLEIDRLAGTSGGETPDTEGD